MIRYRQHALSKMSVFHTRRLESGRYWYPVPGNRIHVSGLSHVPFKFFDRRVSMGRVIGISINKLNSLYWRYHESL